MEVGFFTWSAQSTMDFRVNATERQHFTKDELHIGPRSSFTMAFTINTLQGELSVRSLQTMGTNPSKLLFSSEQGRSKNNNDGRSMDRFRP